jgi:hypothetical protein
LKKEYDPFGLELGDTDPYLQNAEPDYASMGGSFYREGGNPFGDVSGCNWDGMAVPCHVFEFAINSGYIHDPSQQRGFNQLGGPSRFNQPGMASRTNRFDNAAEYSDSVDAWQSPLWIGGAAIGDGLLGEGRFAHAPQNTGQFTPDQQKQVNDLNERVKKLLHDDCARLLGGTRNAAALLNRAQEQSANTVNPNYKGTQRRFPTVARRANALALNPNSTNLAYSEQGIPGLQGRNIYLNDRFFTNIGPSQQDTVFIHELNRNKGYPGTDVDDYARITKACGTANPYGTKQ